jgi:hypothetical protein
MHEQAAEVLRVLLDPVVLGLDLFPLQEPQHVLLELPGMISTSGAFFSTASSIIACNARSMSCPRL